MTPQRLKLLRFAVVGATVAGVYIALYVAFLAVGLPQMAANGIAFLLAVAAQYFGQAWFTFRAPLADPVQVLRFGIMIGAGLATSALVTGGVGPALGLPHWGAAALVTVILPVQNYLIISRWVFARRPEQMETSQ